MTTHESQTNMYYINDKPIPTQELTDYGLNCDDISKLIDDGIIEKNKEIEYESSSFESLYNQGIYFFQNREYKHAFDIFSKCHALNPNHQETNEYLFYISLITKKGAETLYNIYERIKLNSKNKLSNINNVYLFLLTYKTQSANKRQMKIIKKLKYKDLSLEGTNEELLSSHASNLDNVIKTIGNVNDNPNLSEIQKLTINELIKQAKEKREKLYDQIIELIYKEDYSKITDALVHRECHITLDYNFKYTLLLVEKLTQILTTGQVPNPIDDGIPTYNLLDMTEKNLFKKSFDTISNFMKFNTNNKALNIQYILLTKINELIKSIKKQEKINRIFGSIPYDEEIANILIPLIENKRKDAKKLLREYLKHIGKNEYTNLTINFMHIILRKEKVPCEEIVSLLHELSTDEYEYNITPFLQEFYKSLNKSDLESASLCLDIIKQYSPELSSISISLETDLEKVKERINKEKEIIKKYLLEQLTKMKANNNSAIIIELPMCHLLRTKIYQTIKYAKISELRAFSIGEEPKRVVLRYLTPDYKDLIYHGNYRILYSCKKYQECINIIKEQLANSSFGGYNAETYGYLGLSYYHLNDLESALKYLTISNELNKASKHKCYIVEQFDELIMCIQKEINEPQVTSKTPIEIEFEKLVQEINSREEQQESDKQNKPRDIEDIAYYIAEERLSISNARQRFKLSEEETQLIKIIYARDYYTEGMYSQGNKLLQEVEKCKNKTPKVKQQLEEVRANKKFYIHRTDIYTRKRILNEVND